MNKNFFSILLIMTITVANFSFANEEKQEAPKSNVPECILNDLDVQVSILEQHKLALEEHANSREEEVKKEDKADKNTIEKIDKEIAEINELIAIQEGRVVALKRYVKDTYEQSRLDKIVAPITKMANYIANNAKAALAVEVTGVLALTYIIYKSFFASQEDEEEEL